MGRKLRAKLLLARLPQIGDPVAIGRQSLLDDLTLQADFPQVRAHPPRPLAPCRATADEAFDVAAVVDEPFAAQPLDHASHDGWIVTLIEQFAAQILGGVIAAR